MTKLKMKDRLWAVLLLIATFGGQFTLARKFGMFEREVANKDYMNCISLSEKKIRGSLPIPQTQSSKKHHVLSSKAASSNKMGGLSASNLTLLTTNLSDIASLLKEDITWMSFQDQDYVQDFNFLNENAQNYNLLSLLNNDTASISVKESTGLFVPPCTDRNFWENYTIPTLFVQAAQYFVENEIPPWSDEAYLSDIASGTRGVGQTMMISRNIRISFLVLAECKYNNGTFLPTIESDLVSVATQRSWAYPSSDPNLKYFYGTQYFMDLQSSYMTRQFGMTLYMLGDLLSSTTKTTVTNALYSRVFNPIQQSYDGTGPWQLWISSDSNINTVIWAGVMVAVFCVCGPDDRSYFASKSIASSKLYLNTFMDDGFAVEGIGYFNYGFSHYSLLRQALYEGTAGSYDAFAIPKAAQVALFAKEFGMNNGDGMNFADCHFDLYFDSVLLKTIDKSFLDVLPLETATFPNRLGSINLASYIGSTFPLDIPVVSGVKTYGMNALRRYYNVSGALVTRPNQISNGTGLAATIKLGGNLGGHSHDDLGSYVISLNGVKLTGDVGGPLYYDVNTFNSKRYNSPLINSFGHPVPVVGGLLQTRATKVLSSSSNTVKVLSKNFTDEQDTITYDLMAAYDYPSLQSLSREFQYNRLLSTITITDTVEFGESSTFQDALITKKALTFTAENAGYFSDSGNTLYFTVCSDAPFLMNATTLSSYNVTFTRVGIYLLSPVTSAKVTVVFTS